MCYFTITLCHHKWNFSKEIIKYSELNWTHHRLNLTITGFGCSLAGSTRWAQMLSAGVLVLGGSWTSFKELPPPSSLIYRMTQGPRPECTVDVEVVSPWEALRPVHLFYWTLDVFARLRHRTGQISYWFNTGLVYLPFSSDFFIRRLQRLMCAVLFFIQLAASLVNVAFPLHVRLHVCDITT